MDIKECSAAPEAGITNEALYERQLSLLRGFLERGAISQAQYDHSAGELTAKMKGKH